MYMHMGVSKNRGTSKSSILISFPIVFTIHFGGVPHIFCKHPYILYDIYLYIVLYTFPNLPPPFFDNQSHHHPKHLEEYIDGNDTAFRAITIRIHLDELGSVRADNKP